MMRLIARDVPDLEVISAHMQDALVRVADIKYLKNGHKFALIASRFAWETEGSAERRRAGLHAEHVLEVRQQGISQAGPDAILSLLAISWEKGDQPSGHVTLTFSAGITIRLGVEFLELHLRDLGPAWSAPCAPSHPL